MQFPHPMRATALIVALGALLPVDSARAATLWPA